MISLASMSYVWVLFRAKPENKQKALETNRKVVACNYDELMSWQEAAREGS